MEIIRGRVYRSEFEEILTESGVSLNSEIEKIIEKIYTNFKIEGELNGHMVYFSLDVLDDNDGMEVYNYVFNKGFVKGEIICGVVERTKNDDSSYSVGISNVFRKNGEKWCVHEFKNKSRENEFYSCIEDFIIVGLENYDL